jgi:hypothetical protein
MVYVTACQSVPFSPAVADLVSRQMVRVAIIVAAIAVVAAADAADPVELRDARRGFASLQQPSEADRVRYVSRLVRLRESFTRADYKIMAAIDAEVIKHPVPATTDLKALRKRLVGRWQSPRRPYFYHFDGTWASDEDTPASTGGTWRIEGNRFFQDYRGDKPAGGEKIILLTSADFVYGSERAPNYLRRGTAFPWR